MQNDGQSGAKSGDHTHTTKGECEINLPGDELIRQPAVRTTEGVWIDAPAEGVWPWLVQIGQNRGGLYSYQTVEDLVRLDYHDTDRVHPEWQTLVPGDVIRLAPEGWLGCGVASPLPSSRS